MTKIDSNQALLISKTNTAARLDYLDALRCSALLLGVVFHASLSFMPIYIGWAVMDVSTSTIVPSIVLISHSFRMPLFFLLAGFFSHLSFHHKGAQQFLRTRVLQIAVPLVCGWFILRPLLIAGWHIGAQSMRGEANIQEGLLAGFMSMQSLPTGILVGTHLWFLYYLLLITVAVLLIRSLFTVPYLLKEKLTVLIDKYMARFANSRGFVFMMAIPSAACIWYMQHWNIDTPDKSLIPNMPVLFLYGGCFVFGWLLHRQGSKITALARLSWKLVAVCIASIACTILLSDYQSAPTHVWFMLIKACYMFSYGVMMWSLICLSMGVCRLWLAKQNKVLRYVADASYWIYLIHLPIVIFMQIAFAELPLPWFIKLFCISTISVSISLLIYDVCVRATLVGQILNGKRKMSVLF